MEYLRLFQTEDAYGKATLNYPSVSLTEDDNVVHFDASSIKYVDLGLSSGTKWANMNIGATKETDYGLYFQWGDTVGYDESTAAAHSTWSTCPGNGGASSYDTSALSTWDTAHLTNNVLNTDVDAAYVHTNGKAKMPTEAQVDELINGTNSEWTTIDGVYGRKFTNKSDSSKYIFIPAAGCFFTDSHSAEGSNGYVWSSSLYTSSIYGAYGLLFSDSNVYAGSNYRHLAFSVRGVKNDTVVLKVKYNINSKESTVYGGNSTDVIMNAYIAPSIANDEISCTLNVEGNVVYELCANNGSTILETDYIFPIKASVTITGNELKTTTVLSPKCPSTYTKDGKTYSEGLLMYAHGEEDVTDEITNKTAPTGYVWE